MVTHVLSVPFSSAGVYGNVNASKIQGAYLIRGSDFKSVFDVAPDWESYDFQPLDFKKDIDFIKGCWNWDNVQVYLSLPHLIVGANDVVLKHKTALMGSSTPMGRSSSEPQSSNPAFRPRSCVFCKIVAGMRPPVDTNPWWWGHWGLWKVACLLDQTRSGWRFRDLWFFCSRWKSCVAFGCSWLQMWLLSLVFGIWYVHVFEKLGCDLKTLAQVYTAALDSLPKHYRYLQIWKKEFRQNIKPRSRFLQVFGFFQKHQEFGISNPSRNMDFYVLFVHWLDICDIKNVTWKYALHGFTQIMPTQTTQTSLGEQSMLLVKSRARWYTRLNSIPGA